VASPEDAKRPPSQLSETLDLLKRYVLQETVGPMRGIGRILLFGLVGAFLLGIGLVVLDLAVLRALQTETGRAFAGHWNFAPYLLAVAASLVVLGGVIFVAVRGGPARARRRDDGRAKKGAVAP
jgi:hypothetical protein